MKDTREYSIGDAVIALGEIIKLLREQVGQQKEQNKLIAEQVRIQRDQLKKLKEIEHEVGLIN